MKLLELNMNDHIVCRLQEKTLIREINYEKIESKGNNF